MYLLNKLKPAQIIPEIKDAEDVKQSYKYWRIRTFYSMYLGYAFYYFTRKSFTFAMPFMLERGFTLSELGILGTILSVVYGVSKFISGVVGDRSNPRYFMAFGLILTGLCNICFGLSSAWVLLAVFWGINAWFQGWGWPGCARLLTHWYSQSERGTWWSLWNTSHNVGGALIPLVVAGCAALWGWRSAMIGPGFLAILVGFFLINRLRDIPQTLGLPPIERFRGEALPSSEGETKTHLSAKEILFQYVLCNEWIWLTAIAYFFVYIIRIGFNDWGMVYLMQSKGYTSLGAASCIVWFEVGGFLGSLCAGWASDKLCGGRRGPVNVFFMAGGLFALATLHWSNTNWAVLNAVLIFSIGFCIFGPQMLLGMVAAELTSKKAAATSSGFAGCFAYLGAAVAGGPLGALTQAWGWEVFFAVLLGCGLSALGLLTPLWSKKSLLLSREIAGKNEADSN